MAMIICLGEMEAARRSAPPQHQDYDYDDQNHNDGSKTDIHGSLLSGLRPAGRSCSIRPLSRQGVSDWRVAAVCHLGWPGLTGAAGVRGSLIRNLAHQRHTKGDLPNKDTTPNLVN
jgi:hypothetical protein